MKNYLMLLKKVTPPALISGIIIGLLVAPSAHAQKFPDRPVQMVVGFPPGGGTDIVARIFADELSQTWRQPVVVENKAGAGGVIATEAIARTSPDGHTLFMGTMGNLAVNQHLYPMKTDTAKDLTPVAQAVAVHFVLVAHPSLEANSVKELIALAKSKPGKINYSSSGIGGAPHLAGSLFNNMAGVELAHIPYRGSGPSFNDLIGGQVMLTFDSLVQALPQIQAGKLKALAVLGSKRSPLLPDVPTMQEAGLKGYDFTNWFGLVAPPGTSPEHVRVLNAAVVDVQKKPAVRAKLEKMGADVVITTPAEFGAFIQAETNQWAKIIKEAGIKAN